MTPENEIVIEPPAVPPAVERVAESCRAGSATATLRPGQSRLRRLGLGQAYRLGAGHPLPADACRLSRRRLVGFSWIALIVTAALYVVRMFAITGFYHRYFSHRTFKTSRVGSSSSDCWCLAVQRARLVAAHHRHHHVYSDKPETCTHRCSTAFLSHMGWFMSHKHFAADLSRVKDLLKYPELRFLDRSISRCRRFSGRRILAGRIAEACGAGLGTNGWQMLVWGFFISTVAVYHGTYTINSLSTSSTPALQDR